MLTCPLDNTMMVMLYDDDGMPEAFYCPDCQHEEAIS